jgi:hypothetical protein
MNIPVAFATEAPSMSQLRGPCIQVAFDAAPYFSICYTKPKQTQDSSFPAGYPANRSLNIPALTQAAVVGSWPHWFTSSSDTDAGPQQVALPFTNNMIAEHSNVAHANSPGLLWLAYTWI